METALSAVSASCRVFLRGFVSKLGLGLLRLSIFRGEPGQLGAAFDLLDARSKFARRLRSGLGLALKEPESCFGCFPPTGGGGNFVAQRSEAAVEPGNRGAEFLNLALGGSAFLTCDAHFLGMFVERRFVRSQRVDHLREELVGVLDFILLHTHLFAGGSDVQAMAFDERARFLAAFHVGRYATFRRENPAFQRLKIVPNSGDLNIEGFHPGSKSRKFGLLLNHFALVNRALFLASSEFVTDRFEIARELAIVLVREMRVKGSQVLHQRLVAAGFGCLTLKGTDLAAYLLDDVLHTEQVCLSVFELAQRFLFLGLVFCDSRRLLENRPAILGTAAQDKINLPLLHDRVGAAPYASIHEELVNVAQPAWRLVEKVFASSVAKNAAGDANFIPLHAQLFFALGKSQRNLGHTEGLTAVRSAEYHVRHLTSP